MQSRRSSQSHRPSLPFGDAASINNRKQKHQLIFVDNDKKGLRRLSAENAAKNRQPIFTDTERQQMSNEVLNSVPGRNSSDALLDIERYDLMASSIANFSYYQGPFGILKLSNDSLQMEMEETSLSWDDCLAEAEEDLNSEEIDFDLLAEIFDFPHQDHDQTASTQFCDLMPSNTDDIATDIIFSQSPIGHCPTEFPDNIEAWSILSHYKERIVPLVSSLGFGQEASWLNLVMPCAVSTLGEIASNPFVGHSKLALLNAVLSTSAFHMGNHSSFPVEYWTSKGENYLKRAQHHFQKCMEEACILPTKASKYKEILMIILSLSTAYMIKGQPDQRLSCLIQAEKFISIHGFNKSTLSPKRRTLHHCYAYMRIMAETTSIMDDITAGMANTSLSSDEDMLYSDFRIYPGIAFSDNIMAMEKDPVIAQRDLHLAIPGRWSLTLFPKIYGIAESFLMLLSQVIRLANERDRSFQNTETETLNLRDFWARAKALEKAIRVLLVSCTSEGHLFEDEGQIEVGNPRARAMYTALSIFFHRRIYDLDPELLQSSVCSVRGFLEQIQEEETGKSDSMATLMWPAFIAACEAVQVDVQRFFASWFERCFSVTGLKNASMAREIIGIIWNQRQETGLKGEICNWPDLLRTTKLRMMCS